MRAHGDDLAHHDFLGFEGLLAKLPQTTWLVERGAKRFVVRSSSKVALLEATAQGSPRNRIVT